MNHFRKALHLIQDENFQRKIRNIISEKKFKIGKPEDLEKAFQYADSEIRAASHISGRVLVYFSED